MVTDFGIAKALNAAKTDAPGGTLTQVGTSIGTPAYMAPEQIAGDPATDHRADIYSFGCVAYEVLTGAAPFAHRQPHQLFAAHMGERPAPLADRRSDCPPEIVDLVTRCLEKDPANRPQSARELLRALDTKHTYSTPVSQPTKPERGGRKLVIGAIAGIALFSAVAALAFRNKSPDSSDVHSLAVLPFENVGGDSANAYFADGLADELTTELSKVPGLALASRTSAFRYRGNAIDIRQVGQELDVGKVIEGTVRRSGNRMRLTAQLTDASNGRMLWTDTYEVQTDDLFAIQDSLAASIVSALRIRLAGNATATDSPANGRGTDNLEAYDLYLRGRYLWAKRGDAPVRQAIGLFEQAIALDPAFARAHAGLAMAASVLPMYADILSDSIYPVGITAGRRAIEIDPKLADGYLGLANNLIYEFRWDEAENYLKRAIELEPDNPTAHQWYGSFLSHTGRLNESISELRRAAQLDPLSAVMRNELGGILSHAGRYQEAEKELRRSIELDSQFVWVNGNLAITLAEQNRIDSAMKYVQKAGITKPVVSIHVLLAANRRAEAQQLLDDFRQAVRPTPTNPDIFMFMHAAARNADSAIYWLNKSIDIRDGTIFATSMSCHQMMEFVQDDPRYLAALARMKVGKCRR